MRRVRPVTSPSERTSTSGNESLGVSAGRGILFQWFPAWWGWSDGNVPTDTLPSTEENSVEKQIEGQLLDALADTVDNNSLLRRDMVFCQLNFSLKEGTFHLCSSENSVNANDQASEDSK